MSFAEATKAELISDRVWSTPIHEGWDIGGRANGGYVMALAGRAMLAASGRTDPASVTAHFLRPGPAGPATTTTEIVKSGRQFTTVIAELRADQPILRLIGSFTDLDPDRATPTRQLATPPELPDPDDCVRLEPGDPFPPPITARFDARLHPDDDFADNGPSGEPRMRAWLRLLDGEQWDTIGLLLAADAVAPTAFNANLGIAWTPTLEMTVHVRARPEPGWLRCGFSSRFISGGYIEEDGEIWDSTGRLVAQSRQLALVPRIPD